MSKFQKKSSFSAKGILYVEDGQIKVENDETGELVDISEELSEFVGKECSVSVAFTEDL